MSKDVYSSSEMICASIEEEGTSLDTMKSNIENVSKNIDSIVSQAENTSVQFSIVYEMSIMGVRKKR